MLYRIDYKHFLLHMIDYFTYDELMHMQYLMISTEIKNVGRASNVAKCNDLYPPYELIADYYTNHNQDIFEKRYMNYLENAEDEDHAARAYVQEVTWVDRVLWKFIMRPLEGHHDVVLFCGDSENFIIDALVKFIKKKTGLEVIDLNEFFTKGKLGPIYIDWDEVWDKGVDIKRAARRDRNESLMSTSDGRQELLKIWTPKEKMAELKRLEYKISKSEKKDLDQILVEAWEQEYS